MFTRCSFDKTENKLSYYRGKYRIKKLCKKLKDCAMKIINYEEKDMIPPTEEEKKIIENWKRAIYVKKRFLWRKVMKLILIGKKLKIIVITEKKFRGAAHSKYNLNYKVTKGIPTIIHNTSYDTHFMINQLAEEF